MKKCLIFLEKNYEKDCLELLGAAEILFGGSSENSAVYVDADTKKADGILDVLIRVPIESEDDYTVRNVAGVLWNLQHKERYDAILIAATHFGRMLAPYLASLLDCGLVADVTEIHRDGDGIEMIRPAYGGRLMAVIQKTKKGPVMMSVRPGVFSFDYGIRKDTELRVYTGELTNSGIKLIEKKSKPKRKDIRESRILVSGGGGAMEDFDLLEELAEKLGGAVSASRMAVDSGKADRVIQVGQSGKFVRPDLYIAEGIYGSIQHVAGIRQAGHIIAVNTDPNAPICSLADIVVEADAAEFTKKLIRRIEEG